MLLFIPPLLLVLPSLTRREATATMVDIARYDDTSNACMLLA